MGARVERLEHRILRTRAVFQTYSMFCGHGVSRRRLRDPDPTALGRQEAWEEPKGRVDDPNRASPDFAETPVK